MTDISPTALVELALDLTASLHAEDRFERLLRTVRNTITCDAVVLLLHESGVLKPLAQQGLSRDTLGRRFVIEDHPRFLAICQSERPVRFAADSPLPDPYDGMLLAQEGNLPIHACMGLPLAADGQLLGILTLDSLTPRVFDSIPERTLDIVTAMAAASLRTAILLDQLEHLSQHNQQVVAELTSEALTKDGGELIGSSQAMEQLKREIALVAPSDYTVLIQGETGVGKELVARTLHQQSQRALQALVYVNCAALPENLVESELFGHVKGAFTGAEKTRAGKFKLADQGTLFLDEIGELPLNAQSKLLRALQNQEIQPVGQDHIQTINVRVIAATNRDLEQEVEAGRFRADLYHRLSVYPLNVEPLRNRPSDISELTGFFCEQIRRKLGLQQVLISHSAQALLENYNWPGNIRELEHVLSRAALRAASTHTGSTAEIATEHLDYLAAELHSPQSLTTPPANKNANLTDSTFKLGNLRQLTEDYQRKLIAHAIEASNGNLAAAARLLEIDRANLNRVIKRLGLNVSRSVLVAKYLP